MSSLFLEKTLNKSKQDGLLFREGKLKSIASQSNFKKSNSYGKTLKQPGMKFSILSKKSIFQEIIERNKHKQSQTQLSNKFMGISTECVGCPSFPKVSKKQQRKYSKTKDHLKELKHFQFLFPNNESCKLIR